MPTFTKLKSGSWRVQVRRKREYVANTFIRRRDAEEWAIEVERSIDRGIHLCSITRATSHNAEFRPPNNHPMISESQNRRKSAPNILVRKS